MMCQLCGKTCFMDVSDTKFKLMENTDFTQLLDELREYINSNINNEDEILKNKKNITQNILKGIK